MEFTFELFKIGPKDINPRPDTDEVYVRSMGKIIGTVTKAAAEDFVLKGVFVRSGEHYLLAWTRLFTAAEVRALITAFD